MAGSAAEAAEILEFWFGGAALDALPSAEVQRRWFAGGPAFDAEIAARFGARMEAGEAWMEALAGAGAAGRLAAILVGDQFSRNLWRGQGRAFALDAAARALVVAALEAGEDREAGPHQRVFFYLPLEHHEDAASQAWSVLLFTGLAAAHPEMAFFLGYAEKHAEIVARFGRFPGRNAALGRADTPEEAAWIAAGGETFGQGRQGR